MFRQIRGNLVSFGLCIFGIWLLVQMEANVHNQNAGQRQSPLSATFTPTGTPCSTGCTRCNARNSDLTFICCDADAKVQIQIQDPQICLEFLRFVHHSATVVRNPDVNCSDNLQIGALGTSNSHL